MNHAGWTCWLAIRSSAIQTRRTSTVSTSCAAAPAHHRTADSAGAWLRNAVERIRSEMLVVGTKAIITGLRHSARTAAGNRTAFAV